jgi:predicted Rossmann-fold nucleotide-binding protein
MKTEDIIEKTDCVGGIGAGECADSVYDLARQVGYEIGKRGGCSSVGDWVVFGRLSSYLPADSGYPFHDLI